MLFLREPVDHRPERRAQLGLRAVLEAQIGAAVRRAAPGLHLLDDGVGRDVAGDDVAAVLADAVAGGELLAVAVEQPSAELVAERIPHDRVHADETRRQMPDREELHEFHVDERRAGAQRERVAVAAHVGGGAVAAVEAGEPAGGDDRRLGGDGDRRAARQMQRHRARDLAAAAHEIDDQQIAGLADGLGAGDHAAQRLRHRRAGVEEVDIDAARAVVAGREGLRDVAVLARPADAPRVHLADAVGAVLAQQPRQPLVAQPAAGFERVVVVVAPVVGDFLAERDRDRHLRHDGGAAAPDQAAVGEKDAAAGARRLDRRIHAGAARSDDQDVGLDMHGVGDCAGVGHVRHCSPDGAERHPGTAWRLRPRLPDFADAQSGLLAFHPALRLRAAIFTALMISG